MTKKMKKSIMYIIIVLIFAVNFSNALPTNISTVMAFSNAKINKSQAIIYKGKTLTLKISGTNSKITWISSKKSVATVDKNGKVTAKGTGTATITAKVNNKNYTCKITVKLTKKQSAAYKAYRKMLINGKDAVVYNTPGDIYNGFIKYVNADPDTYLFTLIDLNGDNIDELFIKDGQWDSSYGHNSWVFSYNPDDKKIYNLIWDDVESICSYNPLKNGILVERYWYAGGQSDSFAFYKLGSDNKRSKVKELNYFVGDWADLPPYSIDNKGVTEEEWNKVLNSNFTNNIIAKNNWHACNKELMQKYIN